MDHCQNAAYLADALHIPVAMSEKDVNMIPDNRKQRMSAKTFYLLTTYNIQICNG